MNIFTYFRSSIFSSLEHEYRGVLVCEDVKVEYPKNQEHGDLSTNVAMIIGKKLNISPKEVANKILSMIQKDKFIEEVSVAGAGFLNIRLKKDFWSFFLMELLKLGHHYPEIKIGNGEKVNVEFVSANPTGPLHIGHAKGAVFGDAIANLLTKCGYNVAREFYVNDAGNQISILAKSLDIRYKQLLGEDVELEEGCYPGEYLIELAKELNTKFGAKLNQLEANEKEDILKSFATDEMLKIIKQDLEELGVHHDVFTSEKELIQNNKVANAIDFLQSKNLLYKGTLEKPKGESADDWEAREQLLFKSSAFGDDGDRAVMKSDGTYTYFAPDIAYHLDKFERGYNNMVLLLGADHVGYKKRLTSAVKALSDGKAELNVKICQLVKLLRDGVQVKMSKRSGNFITMKEVLDEIGKDALRFAILTKSSDTVLDIDMEKIKQQTKENPVFYVQYASARANSIFRKAKEIGLDIENLDINDVDLSLLNTEYDINIIKFLALFPKILESCTATLDPHKITYYLYDLACTFHQIWSKGTKDEDIKFIVKENMELTKARISLTKALLIVIESGLGILGIESMKSM
jgi:arginyl-tRNA synthetase